MTYVQFIEAIEKKIKKEVTEEKRVSIHTNMKNNGVKKRGIMITEEGINISPTIYLEEYYKQFLCGRTQDAIVKDILELYEKIRFQDSWKDGEKLKEYDQIKDKIVYRVIGRAANQELLREVPYKEYQDLAIVYYVALEVDEYGIASMLVKNEHLKMWKIREEDLYYHACRNTQEIFPCEFMQMKKILEELLGFEEEEGPGGQMYILSNEMRNYGAAALLYPDRLRMAGEVIGENYYILPSSVHEVILVAESEAPEKEELEALVKEMNETQVEEEEVLSNQVYYYDRKSGRLIP